MPRRKQGYKTPFTLTNAQKVARTAYTAAATAKICMSLLNVELKHFDTESTIYPYTSAFIPVALFNIPQGDADNERNGEKLRIKSLNIQGSIVKQTGASAPDNNLIKLVLVKCPQVHSDTAPETQVYTTQSMTSFRNMDFTKKFSVVWTKVISLNTISTKKLFEKYIKLDLPVSFTSSAGDSVEANQYFLMATADNTNSAATCPTLTIKTRVRYLDN